MYYIPILRPRNKFIIILGEGARYSRWSSTMLSGAKILIVNFGTTVCWELTLLFVKSQKKNNNNNSRRSQVEAIDRQQLMTFSCLIRIRKNKKVIINEFNDHAKLCIAWVVSHYITDRSGTWLIIMHFALSFPHSSQVSYYPSQEQTFPSNYMCHSCKTTFSQYYMETRDCVSLKQILWLSRQKWPTLGSFSCHLSGNAKQR